MTSLRGLDGIHAKPEGHQKKGGSLNLRDDSVLDHFAKQISRGLLDIDERMQFMGKKSIFDFGFEMSQLDDPFQVVQANALNLEPAPKPERSPETSADKEEVIDDDAQSKKSSNSSEY